MRAGKLRHTVILQSPGGTRNAFGERVTTWSDVVTVSASIEPLRAQELFIAAQQNMTVTHRIRLRYQSDICDINNSWRVLFGTRAFPIESIRNIDERNREFELLCSEGKATE